LNAEHSRKGSSLMASSFRTFFVFLDLPFHVEYETYDFPVLDEGSVIEFRMSVRDPKNLKNSRKIEGEYRITSRKLVFETKNQSKTGFSQYLELEPAV